MQTLHAAVATPSQKLAAAARRERERKIAAQARPDSAIACPSASVRSQQAGASRPSPQAVQAWSERQKKIHAPIKTWFWIVDELNPPPALKLSIEEIQIAVARHYQVGHPDLISARRTADVVRPRQIAMFLAKNLTPNSLPVIGRKFGGRDHTTVLHAIRKIEALRSRDTTLAMDLDAISRAVAARVA
jgi:chromosomal replication initiation ATPase DnaA